MMPQCQSMLQHVHLDHITLISTLSLMCHGAVVTGIWAIKLPQQSFARCCNSKTLWHFSILFCQNFGSTFKAHGALVYAGMLGGASQNPGPSPTGVRLRGLRDFRLQPPPTPSPKPVPRLASSPRGLCQPAPTPPSPPLSPSLMPHALLGPLERPQPRYMAGWIDG